MAFRDSCDSFAAAMAFLDEVLSESSDTLQPQVAVDDHSTSLPTLTDGDWDPYLLLESIGDFRDDAVETINPLAPDVTTSLVPWSHQLQLETTNFDAVGVDSASTSRKSKKQKTTEKGKNTLNYDPNKARNGRRFELIHLRKESRELELKLQQLQAMKEREDFLLGRTSLSNTRVKTTPAVWEEICDRQLERRLKAERENVLLKKKCEKGRQVARSIERMVRKRLAQQDVAYSDSNTPTRRVGIPPGFSSHMTSRIFDELLAGVEASYHEVDDVFGDNSHVSKQPRREPMLRDNANDMEIDLFYGKIMPFEVDAIGGAWWQRWHSYKGQCTSNNDGNTIAEKFGLEMRDARTNTTATFYDQQILRRYVEKDRIVIVWCAYIEPLEFEKRPVNDIYFLERGYVLITPHDHDEDSASSDNNTFSRVRTCYMLTPKSTGRKLRHDSRTTSLVDFVANAVSANMSMIVEMVENMLLDQSICLRKGT